MQYVLNHIFRSFYVPRYWRSESPSLSLHRFFQPIRGRCSLVTSTFTIYKNDKIRRKGIVTHLMKNCTSITHGVIWKSRFVASFWILGVWNKLKSVAMVKSNSFFFNWGTHLTHRNVLLRMRFDLDFRITVGRGFHYLHMTNSWKDPLKRKFTLLSKIVSFARKFQNFQGYLPILVWMNSKNIGIIGSWQKIEWIK